MWRFMRQFSRPFLHFFCILILYVFWWCLRDFCKIGTLWLWDCEYDWEYMCDCSFVVIYNRRC
jgi:hypothetical protein